MVYYQQLWFLCHSCYLQHVFPLALFYKIIAYKSIGLNKFVGNVFDGIGFALAHGQVYVYLRNF